MIAVYKTIYPSMPGSGQVAAAEGQLGWGQSEGTGQVVGRNDLELVPLFVFVFEHDMMGRLGKVLCLIHHSG